MFKLAVIAAFLAGFAVVAIPLAPGAVELASITGYLAVHPTERHTLFCIGQAAAGLDGLKEEWKSSPPADLVAALDELADNQSEGCKAPSKGE
jgi:hypothetical protein